MAQMYEMLASVPASLRTYARRAERNDREARMKRLYADTMHKADSLGIVREAGIAQTMQQQRPRKKAKNSFSREEAGTCGTITCTKRFTGSYIHVVYKRHNNI